ncbi:hypothetical protein [Candidatus Cetobacterium colombiensis]|uniref:Uncharacterized protein n=1 Tax=Candidatus Cetobacterium colombiensis TaxID=3073100 RepID=A0ABU4WEW8_9FUSO|nr:hypothetical protein [Candidatus Cetobacterium colombiensis]MDX8337239.1 hypothetical protein [Candidatus Cetobacterium colombiensis]
MDFMFLGADFINNEYFYKINNNSNFFNDSKLLKKFLAKKEVVIGAIESSNYLAFKENSNYFTLNPTEALIWDLFYLDSNDKLPFSLKVENKKSILIFYLSSDFIEYSIFNFSFEKNTYISSELEHNILKSFSSVSIDLELKKILEDRYNENLTLEKIKRLRESLEENLSFESYVNDNEYELNFNDYNKALNRAISSFYNNEKLTIFDKKYDYFLFSSNCYISSTLKIKLKNLVSSLNIDFLNFDFSLPRGACFYVENLKTKNFELEFDKEKIEKDLIHFEELCFNYKTAIQIETKKEIILEVKNLEKKIISSVFKIDYLEKILENIESCNTIALGRYFYIMGEISKKYTALNYKIEAIFLNYISSKNLIKYNLNTFPEYIIFSIIGLGKLNNTIYETDLLNILEFSNSKSLYPYIFLSLGFIGTTTDTLNAIFLHLKRNALLKKECFIAIGKFAELNPKYKRFEMIDILKFCNKELMKTNCYCVNEILYCVLEIALKNNGINDRVLQDLINTISILDNISIINCSLKKIALKVLNLIPLEQNDLINLNEIRNKILPQYFQNI